MNRRQFIVYTAAATASAVVAGTWLSSLYPRAPSGADGDDAADVEARVERLRAVVDDPDLVVLLAVVPDLESAAAIGAHVRANDAPHRDEAGLVQDLMARLVDRAVHADVDVEGVRRRLREEIVADFAADRTVMVDGWLLAETNTELFALVSFVDERTGITDASP